MRSPAGVIVTSLVRRSKICVPNSSSSFLIATDKRRLADEAGIRRTAEMPLARDRDHVAEFGQCHAVRQFMQSRNSLELAYQRCTC